MRFDRPGAAAPNAAAALPCLFSLFFLSLRVALAPPELAAQAVEATDLTAPPESRLLFEVSASDTMLELLLAEHGCRMPAAGLSLTLAGRVFDPPLVLRPDAAAGRSDPAASLSTQWAHLAAGDVERATAGWVPEDRAIAAALLEDPEALARYREQAGGIDRATVEAIAWIEPASADPPDAPAASSASAVAQPVAVLLSASNPTGFALGMPTGYVRTGDEGFLLGVAIARDPRFAIVGAAAGTYRTAEQDPASDRASYEEACGGAEAGG